jgi:pyruvate/2-oxoglutarate dehydrogenase complex dihydrolipoamide dehydrogenase (E3) component
MLRGDGIELFLGVRATSAKREDEDYVLELEAGTELRGDRLLVATGRRPRADDIGLETVGVKTDGRACRSIRGLGLPSGCGRSATLPASGR